MDISQLSTEQLKEEIERREKVKMEAPTPKDNINWDSVIKSAEHTVNEVVNGTYDEDNDDAHYMWEEVMIAVYGKDFFEWFNRNAYS